MLLLPDPAVVAEVPGRDQAGGALRADPGALRRGERGELGEDLLVGDGDGGAARLAHGAQHQEVAERLRHVDPEGDRVGALDQGALLEAGVEGVHDRAAARRLHRDQPRQPLPDPAQLAHLQHRLVDADQADAATGRVEDHVGHPPAELLRDLVAHRLLALDAVGLLERRDLLVPLALLDRRLHQRPGVVDQAVDEIELGARRDALAPGDLGCVDAASRSGCPSRRGRRRPTRRRRRCRWWASRSRARRAHEPGTRPPQRRAP